MLDRTLAPPFNRSTSFELIQPQKKILKGGAESYFILGGTQEVSKVEIVFAAGRWVEKTWGASYFTSNLLSKGTKKKDEFRDCSFAGSLWCSSGNQSRVGFCFRVALYSE